MILHLVYDEKIRFVISQRRVDALREAEKNIPEGTIVLAFVVNTNQKIFESPIYGRLQRDPNERHWYIQVDNDRLSGLPYDIVIPQESFTDEDKVLFTTLRLADQINHKDE